MDLLKFFTDEMCGDITRWLRMLGYDTVSPVDHPNTDGSSPNDDEIIKICFATHRILISKDVEIIKKMKEKSEKLTMVDKKFLLKFEVVPSQEPPLYPCLLLKSTDLTNNLSEIGKYFLIHFEYNSNTARCPKCNFHLQKIKNPKDFIDFIPANVYKYHKKFWKCSNSECGKIFWKGTHLERIIQTLKNIQKNDHVKDIKELSRNIH